MKRLVFAVLVITAFVLCSTPANAAPKVKAGAVPVRIKGGPSGHWFRLQVHYGAHLKKQFLGYAKAGRKGFVVNKHGKALRLKTGSPVRACLVGVNPWQPVVRCLSSRIPATRFVFRLELITAPVYVAIDTLNSSGSTVIHNPSKEIFELTTGSTKITFKESDLQQADGWGLVGSFPVGQSITVCQTGYDDGFIHRPDNCLRTVLRLPYGTFLFRNYTPPTTPDTTSGGGDATAPSSTTDPSTTPSDGSGSSPPNTNPSDTSGPSQDPQDNGGSDTGPTSGHTQDPAEQLVT
jgi:hypothetical protein